jgi:hypothetical protein
MNEREQKIYHITHIDRLSSAIALGGIYSDAEVRARNIGGTTIGMSTIKQRRLEELTLASHPDLHVGDCVPFYFCPRSVMLYLIYKRNHADATYMGGQEPIIHLEASLFDTVDWAKSHDVRWAFTNSNAGSRYFEDYSDLRALSELDWDAISATQWKGCQEKKQAEFLVERFFPWNLFNKIGVYSDTYRVDTHAALVNATHKPIVSIMRDWYY